MLQTLTCERHLQAEITQEESENHDKIQFEQKLPLCTAAGIHGIGNVACLFEQR
jgi:hypothetical protein